MRWLLVVALIPLTLRAQSDFDQCVSATPQTVQQQAARGEPAGQYCLGFFHGGNCMNPGPKP